MVRNKRNDLIYRITRRELIAFCKRPEMLDTLIEFYEKDDGKSTFWEAIFVHFYGEMPNPFCDEPGCKRPGEFDPRWEELFGDIGANQAFSRLEEVLKRIDRGDGSVPLTTLKAA